MIVSSTIDRFAWDSTCKSIRRHEGLIAPRSSSCSDGRSFFRVPNSRSGPDSRRQASPVSPRNCWTRVLSSSMAWDAPPVDGPASTYNSTKAATVPLVSTCMIGKPAFPLAPSTDESSKLVYSEPPTTLTRPFHPSQNTPKTINANTPNARSSVSASALAVSSMLKQVLSNAVATPPGRRSPSDSTYVTAWTCRSTSTTSCAQPLLPSTITATSPSKARIAWSSFTSTRA